MYMLHAKLLHRMKIAEDEEINVAVTTGNFEIFRAALLYAKNMGIPDCKAGFRHPMRTKFSMTSSRQELMTVTVNLFLTTSPSMDILISSNLERLIYKISGEDARKDTGS